MADKTRDNKVRCSFCNKTEEQVRKLIAGPDGAYICDGCVSICSEIIDEEFAIYDEEEYNGTINLMKPQEMNAILEIQGFLSGAFPSTVDPGGEDLALPECDDGTHVQDASGQGSHLPDPASVL